jgi:hypothetical protein
LLDYRPHPANEVFVTGSFDDWGKTVKLDRKGDVFTKEVQLPSADEKVHYKVSSDLRSFSFTIYCCTSFQSHSMSVNLMQTALDNRIIAWIFSVCLRIPHPLNDAGRLSAYFH